VTIEKVESGGVNVIWSESGGPVVVPPKRRGFGSTIIESSIPHELGGKAEVRYERDGLIAEFFIPAQHVAAIVSLAKPVLAGAARIEAERDASLLSGEVLIVEDNLIIAMEAEDKLQSLGAERCHVAGNTHAALEIAKKTALQFALLDVNLGSETSEVVAEYLTESGVPFVVASGYGEDIKTRPALKSAICVMKPYSNAELTAAIAKTLAQRA
jgi:CheY-like chemotaxis protein